METNKFYRHSNGLIGRVICQAKTIMFGECFLLEITDGTIEPVIIADMDDDWQEITEQDFKNDLKMLREENE
mgnify:CR=1 FL=1